MWYKGRAAKEGKKGKYERKEKVRKCGERKRKQAKIDCKCDGKAHWMWL